MDTAMGLILSIEIHNQKVIKLLESMDKQRDVSRRIVVDIQKKLYNKLTQKANSPSESDTSQGQGIGRDCRGSDGISLQQGSQVVKELKAYKYKTIN